MCASLIGVTIAFAAGIILGSHFRSGFSPVVLYGMAVGVFLVSLLIVRWRRGFLSGLLIVIALLGVLRYQTAQPSMELLYRRAGQLREVTGTVVSYPDLGKGYTAFVLAPDHIPAKIRVTCFWEEGERAKILHGDRLQLVGKGEVPKRFADFDYRTYLARQGIFATMAVNGEGQIEHIGAGGNPVFRYGDAIRQKLLARLDRALPLLEAGLAHGLLFGERAALSEDVEEAFRRTGLMHLLAVSGLHLGIFLAGLWFVLRLCGLRPVITYPLVGVAVLLVLWVVGPRVSLVRAALLFAFLGLGSVLADIGIILRRWVSPYQGLAAAALVILAMRPTALFDAGFQLSFGATAAIIATFDPTFGVQVWVQEFAERVPLPAWSVSYPLALLVVSLSAQAGTAPFLAYHFGEIHPLLVVANLIVIPLATCALWCGLIAVLFLPTPLFLPMAAFFGWVLKSLIWVVTKLAAFPFAVLGVPSWIGVWLGGLVLFLFGVGLYSRGESSWTLYSTSITSRSFSTER